MPEDQAEVLANGQSDLYERLVVSSPQVVYLSQIVETGTIRQRLYMKGDSNEHAQER